jgi:hypothetical protein
MIKLSIDKTSIDALNREINLKVEAIGYMTQPAFLEEVSRAAFVILGQRFMQSVDRFSATNQKRMHHLYEWNRVGNPSARLFVLNKVSMLDGALTIQADFLQSKTPVPINPDLLIPGTTGKIVTKRNIFRDKAQIMEEGRSVSYEARSMLAFMGTNGLSFIRPGAIVNIRNPGGQYVKGALASFMSAWYAKNSQVIMDESGLYEKIAEEASIVLSKQNSGITDVRNATIRVVDAVVGGRNIIR